MSVSIKRSHGEGVVGLCDVDNSVPLNKLNVLLKLLHGCLHPLLSGLLGCRIRDDAQALVLMVELLPVLLQTCQQLLPVISRGGGG